MTKIYREGKWEWVHFCYVFPAEWSLYRKLKLPVPYCIDKWSIDDFRAGVTSWRDLEILRRNIKRVYQERYPELYVDSPTDYQGWIRLWFVEKTKKELENNEQCSC